MAYTKGPWLPTNSTYIDTEDGVRIAQIYNHAPGYTANADLIAAAPQLLEALRWFMRCQFDGARCAPNDSDFVRGAEAIAKAESRPSP